MNIRFIIVRIVLLFTFILSFSIAKAQISYGGEPYSFSHSLENPNILSPDNTELLNIIKDNNKECSAMEFGKFLSLNVSLENDQWQKTFTADGSTLYRLTIKSHGAQAVGAYFTDFFIPNTAKLFIYSPNKKQLIGSFTSFNNASSGLFATEYIVGDELTIEYIEPKSVHGLGHFTISEILHAYRGIAEDSNEKGFGGSGDCEVNVNCPEGDLKKKQRDAVVRLLIKIGKSSVWCTGSLINNTSEDRTPYVITADHCGKDSSEEDHEQWLFYFNYQSDDCENPQSEPTHKSMVGCAEIASSSNAGSLGSDFYLVLLNQEIPEEYDPFFLGWNRNGLASENGYTIHHPQGDIKKISKYTETLTDASYSGGIANGFWEVFWVETESGHGVTEGGSSGSPLFDNEGYIIGTLTGGQASCSSTGLTAPDYYGKFRKHWDSNGSDDDQMLSPWLDPLNTGVEKMSGIYLGIDEEQILADHLFQAIPNPATSAIVLYFDSNERDFQIQISDLSGKIIQEYSQIENSPKSIQIDHLQKGIYFITVTTNQKAQTSKLLKL